jgi:DNA-directed RNA polymerase specialized sigma24 family protein
MTEDPDKFIPTRESLLSRLKDWDDQESWRRFFDTYWRLIYRAALKAGLIETEAQDVVQETLISVAQKMPGFKYEPAIDSFKGWLFYQTRLRIADQFRKRKRTGRKSDALWMIRRGHLPSSVFPIRRPRFGPDLGRGMAGEFDEGRDRES